MLYIKLHWYWLFSGFTTDLTTCRRWSPWTDLCHECVFTELTFESKPVEPRLQENDFYWSVCIRGRSLPTCNLIVSWYQVGVAHEKAASEEAAIRTQLKTNSSRTISSTRCRMLLIREIHPNWSDAFSFSLMPSASAIWAIIRFMRSRQTWSVSAKCSYNLPDRIRRVYRPGAEKFPYSNLVFVCTAVSTAIRPFSSAKCAW